MWGAMHRAPLFIAPAPYNVGADAVISDQLAQLVCELLVEPYAIGAIYHQAVVGMAAGNRAGFPVLFLSYEGSVAPPPAARP